MKRFDFVEFFMSLLLFACAIAIFFIDFLLIKTYIF